MTRTEFMKQLQDLLSDISKNEREEALQYYMIILTTRDLGRKPGF